MEIFVGASSVEKKRESLKFLEVDSPEDYLVEQVDLSRDNMHALAAQWGFYAELERLCRGDVLRGMGHFSPEFNWLCTYYYSSQGDFYGTMSAYFYKSLETSEALWVYNKAQARSISLAAADLDLKPLQFQRDPFVLTQIISKEDSARRAVTDRCHHRATAIGSVLEHDLQHLPKFECELYKKPLETLHVFYDSLTHHFASLTPERVEQIILGGPQIPFGHDFVIAPQPPQGVNAGGPATS